MQISLFSCKLIRGIESNFGLVQRIELAAKGNLAAHAGGVWGHAP